VKGGGGKERASEGGREGGSKGGSEGGREVREGGGEGGGGRGKGTKGRQKRDALSSKYQKETQSNGERKRERVTGGDRGARENGTTRKRPSQRLSASIYIIFNISGASERGRNEGGQQDKGEEVTGGQNATVVKWQTSLMASPPIQWSNIQHINILFMYIV